MVLALSATIAPTVSKHTVRRAMSTSPWYLADKSLFHDFSVASHFPDLIINETELLISADSAYSVSSDLIASHLRCQYYGKTGESDFIFVAKLQVRSIGPSTYEVLNSVPQCARWITYKNFVEENF